MSIIPQIHLTSRAAQRIQQLVSAENDSKTYFRIYITGGGCSGFQYGFKLDENQEPDDIVIQKTVDSILITVLIDPLSFQYLMDSEIDFMMELQGARFLVRNPNAETTCGCGSSFSLKEEKEESAV